jgi:hypothetical protein
MEKKPWMVKTLIEHLLAWVAFIGYVLWTILWAFTYALMGGWGGTPTFSPPFVLWILAGYAIYGLLMSFIYLSFGRVRFLPWRLEKRSLKDFCILLIVSLSALVYYLLFFIRG